MRTPLRAAVLACITAAAPAALAQPCTPEWLPTFSSVELTGGADTLLVADAPAGSGPPTIYAGGHFTRAGGLLANGIARWDGSSWSPIGPAPPFGGSPGVNTGGYVLAMTLFDDDGPGPHAPALYIGGSFYSVGGQSAACIARWDGSNWIDVGGGVTNFGGAHISAMAVYDEEGPGPSLPALFVTGAIDHAGGVPVHNIARWNGTAWSDVGGGLTNGNVGDGGRALLVFDEDGSGPVPPCLYVAGSFSTAGVSPALGVARWNGVEWSALGGGQTVPRDLCAFDPDGPGPAPARLVACNEANGNGTVAMWDGATWTPLGGLFNAGVWHLATFDDDGGGPHSPALYATGPFQGMGQLSLRGVARWNGTAWEDPGIGVGGGIMALMDPDGSGSQPPVLLMGSVTLGAYDGQTWRPLGDGIIGTVYSLAGARVGAAPEAELYAGGRFSYAGGTQAANIARWDGDAWHALGAGVAGSPQLPSVNALAEFDPDGPGPQQPVLIAAGQFNTAGGHTVANIAFWDGAQWSAMGNGLDALVRTLVVFDPDGAGPQLPTLYAGGSFQNSGFVPVRYLARWTGAAWEGVPGATGVVSSLAAFDDDGPGPDSAVMLVAMPNGQGSTLQKYDGTTWTILGSQMDGAILAITSLDPDGGGPQVPRIYVGGSFNMISGVLARHAAVLVGSQWSTVGLGFNANLDWDANAVTAFDATGEGPRPYFGGGFASAGTVPVSGVAEFDGADWHDMQGGVTSPTGRSVAAMIVFQGAGSPTPSLMVGGDFLASGAVSAGHIARWACPPAPVCYANCDGSTIPPILNVNDFACFLNRFAAGDPYANCDGSTTPPVLNVNDFVCFAGHFAAGCR